MSYDVLTTVSHGQGFEGNLLWESQDPAGLMTLNVSKVQLNTGGGVIKLGHVSTALFLHLSIHLLLLVTIVA